MADRRRQIELLIATRFDHLWFPAGALRTSPGLAPTKRVPCHDCATGGRPGQTPVKRGGVIIRWDPCTSCGGHPATDTTRAKKGRGFIAVDPMDTDRRAVGSADTHATARPRKRVKCDACQDHDGKPTGVVRGQRCRHCDGTGHRDLHRFDLQLDTRDIDGAVDQLTAAIHRRDELGSYHDLDVALAAIRRHVNKPLEYQVLTDNAQLVLRILDDVYLTRTCEVHDLSLFEQALVDLAFRYLDWRLPDQLRVPPGVAANDRARADQLRKVRGRGTSPQALAARDKEIRKLIRQEKATQWVAAEFGLTVSQVNRIVAGDTQAAR